MTCCCDITVTSTVTFERQWIKKMIKQTSIGEIPENDISLNRNMSFLLKILEDVRKETEEHHGKEAYIWSEHYSNWIDIWKHFHECLGGERFLNSCLGFRLTQLNKELLWFWFECTSGVYDNAFRDLRYILESFLQAYYVDEGHQDATMECKLEILKEVDRVTGRKLIDRLHVDGKYKDQIKALYSELCKYIHPSYEEWKRLIREGKVDSKITFHYDKELFEESIRYTDRVIDVIVFLLMNSCEDVVNKVKNDEIFLKSISNVEDSLVIQYIQAGGEG